MRKGDDGEEKREKNGKKKKKKKIMMKIVATNVVASRPPERRPTATPNARANYRTAPILGVWLIKSTTTNLINPTPTREILFSVATNLRREAW